MRKMPYEIKQILRQYANLQMKVARMAKEIEEVFLYFANKEIEDD